MVIINFLAIRWLEIGSLLCALGYAVFHCSGTGRALTSNDTWHSILHGLALFPLCLLALAILLPFEIPLQSEKLIFSGAAIIAVLSILERRRKTEAQS
jgi:hypothetical protein